MTRKETKLGFIAVAGLIVALPFANGCAGGGGGGGGSIGELDPATNSRVAYITTSDGADGTGLNGDANKVGANSATVTADGTTASFATPTDDIDDQNGLTRTAGADTSITVAGRTFPAEAYNDATGSMNVFRITDVDGNGTDDDTFLTVHTNNPLSPTDTQYAASYTGTRSDPAVVAELQDRTSHHATYSGVGTVQGSMGETSLALDGALDMTVNFAGETTGIDGKINVTTPAGEDNAAGVDQVTFGGNIIDGSADYSIDNIKLKRGITDVAVMDTEAGVGSLFGPHAGGTIGVFAGTGHTTDADPSNVNIIGGFTGSTTDNDPAPAAAR